MSEEIKQHSKDVGGNGERVKRKYIKKTKPVVESMPKPKRRKIEVPDRKVTKKNGNVPKPPKTKRRV